MRLNSRMIMKTSVVRAVLTIGLALALTGCQSASPQSSDSVKSSALESLGLSAGEFKELTVQSVSDGKRTLDYPDYGKISLSDSSGYVGVRVHTCPSSGFDLAPAKNGEWVVKKPSAISADGCSKRDDEQEFFLRTTEQLFDGRVTVSRDGEKVTFEHGAYEIVAAPQGG